MRDKFGLDFRIVDSNLMKELRRKRDIHVNPWNHFPRLLTSIDFLKRERPLRLFREILPGPDEPTYHRKFDLLNTMSRDRRPRLPENIFLAKSLIEIRHYRHRHPDRR